jgi:TRAP-type C4-dicarboxylate transport system permease small subunit
MSERVVTQGRPVDKVGRLLDSGAIGFAYLGGLALCALTALTVVSVTLRALTTKPIPGDYEIVQLLMAVTIFCFLPYCHMRKGNVIVDVFTLRAPKRLNAALDALGGVFYALFAVLLTWRMAEGGYDMFDFGQTTMSVALPIWPAFVPIVASLVYLVFVCLYRFWADLRELRA